MVGRPRSVADEAIFAAVADVVTAVGPAGLTLAAVAERVGLSAPALTQRFGSKRGLLLAFAASESGSPPSVFASGPAGPLEAIRAGLVALTAPITTREGLANNLAFLQLDLTDSELRTHAVAQSRAMRAEIASLLRAAADAGDLVDADPDLLADSLYTVYCGAQVTWAIDGRGKLTDWLAERIDRTLAPHLPAIGTPKAGHGRGRGSTSSPRRP